MDWDTYFMNITKEIAKKSNCLKRQVGAILVLDNRIIATGYNGSPQGLPINCLKNGVCLRQNNKQGEGLENCYAIHAEQNCLCQCAKYGISSKGATLYTNTYPCNFCLRLLINSGIVEIVYLEDYNDPISKEIAKLSNIKIRKYEK